MFATYSTLPPVHLFLYWARGCPVERRPLCKFLVLWVSYLIMP